MKITKEGWAVSEFDFGLSKWVEEQGRLDIQCDYLAQFQKYIPISGTVLDIGACIGDHTLTYSRFVGPSGRVIAIEPNRESFQCLQHNVGPISGITLYNCAAGKEYKMVSMVPETGPHNLGGSRVSGEGDIPMVDMDRLFDDLKRLDFVKIDAEGYEPEILEGMEGIIGRFKPVMLIEVCQTILKDRGYSSAQLLDQIRALGYSVQPSEPTHNFQMDLVDALCLPDKIAQ